MLDTEFADNVKAHILQKDGTYEKVDKRGKTLVNSQEIFCREAWARIPKKNSVRQTHVFIPAEPAEDASAEDDHDEM